MACSISSYSPQIMCGSPRYGEGKVSYLSTQQAVHHGCAPLTVLHLQEHVLLHSHQLAPKPKSPLFSIWYSLSLSYTAQGCQPVLLREDLSFLKIWFLRLGRMPLWTPCTSLTTLRILLTLTAGYTTPVNTHPLEATQVLKIAAKGGSRNCGIMNTHYAWPSTKWD